MALSAPGAVWHDVIQEFKAVRDDLLIEEEFLEDAIERFLAETNADPKPFVWTARPSRILAAVKRGKEKLESIH
jgi:hypothetical protein